MQNIRIEMTKGVEEGRSSVSAGNPTTSNMGSPPISRKGAILAGYGVMLGKRVYDTALSEIRLNGNEAFVTKMENVTKGITTAGLAYATGGLTLVPEAINTGVQLYTNYTANKRENDDRDLMRSMAGKLQDYNSGGGYE